VGGELVARTIFLIFCSITVGIMPAFYSSTYRYSLESYESSIADSGHRVWKEYAVDIVAPTVKRVEEVFGL
jgi:hypothetical protein